jgi:hypothetical protein
MGRDGTEQCRSVKANAAVRALAGQYKLAGLLGLNIPVTRMIWRSAVEEGIVKLGLLWRVRGVHSVGEAQAKANVTTFYNLGVRAISRKRCELLCNIARGAASPTKGMSDLDSLSPVLSHCGSSMQLGQLLRVWCYLLWLQVHYLILYLGL